MDPHCNFFNLQVMVIELSHFVGDLGCTGDASVCCGIINVAQDDDLNESLQVPRFFHSGNWILLTPTCPKGFALS